MSLPPAGGAAVPLVVADGDGLRVTQQAEALLASIAEPVAVVAVAGPYRSGKSFLLNCLVDEAEPVGAEPRPGTVPPAFGVGSTTNACTRGLWLYAAPTVARGADGSPMRVLYLDSEGLGAVGCDVQHEMRIFSLAVLLGSLFLYNSRGAIDEASLTSLSFITQLAKHVRATPSWIARALLSRPFLAQFSRHLASQVHVKAAGATGPEDFEHALPPFLWVLRDFALQLKDVSGNPITAHQYLEDALKREIGFDDDVTARNRVRMLLTAFFKQRECAALPRPIIEEAALQELGSGEAVSTATLRPGFVEQLNELRAKIFSTLRPKCLHGSKLSGPMFSALLSEYVRAINAGQVPTVERGWGALVSLQSQRALATALGLFGSLLAADPEGERAFPLDRDQLERVRAEANEQATKRLAEDALEPDPETAAALERGMAEAWAAFEKSNEAEWAARGRASLTRLFAPLKERGDLSGFPELMQGWKLVQSEFRSAQMATQNGRAEAVEALIDSFGAREVLDLSGKVMCNRLAQLERSLAECNAQRLRAESSLSEAVAAHAQAVAQRNAAGDATELQTRVDTLSADLRKAGKRGSQFRRCLISNPASVSTETALVVQRSENDSEMVELRLRSEFRDKEVARLNAVIGRLQEKTHAQ